jgi:hypothetical protein
MELSYALTTSLTTYDLPMPYASAAAVGSLMILSTCQIATTRKRRGGRRQGKKEQEQEKEAAREEGARHDIRAHRSQPSAFLFPFLHHLSAHPSQFRSSMCVGVWVCMCVCMCKCVL